MLIIILQSINLSAETGGVSSVGSNFSFFLEAETTSV